MLKDNPAKAEEIAKKLANGYSDHSACINAKEATRIGLNVAVLEGEQREIIWKINKAVVRKSDILAKRAQEDVRRQIKELPPGILDEAKKQHRV